MVDRRTFDGFINCEPPGEPSFEEHVRLGPLLRVKISEAPNSDPIADNQLGAWCKSYDGYGHAIYSSKQ
jgi:hypothetical protein